MKTPKSKKYAVEQFFIRNEILSILGLTSDKYKDGFYLYDIDNNDSIQDKIMELRPDIQKYFCHINITGLIYPERCKRPWLSIARGVIKNHYTLKYKACRYKSGDGSVFTMRYYLEPIKKDYSSKNICLNLKRTNKKQLNLIRISN